MNDAANYRIEPGGAYDKVTDLIGGTNMAAVHLANAVGGSLFLGFISAVAFATILAVVAGLTLAGASAVSHDLYASVIAKGTVLGGQGGTGLEDRGRRDRHASPSISAMSSRTRTSPSWSVSPSRSRRAAISRSC